MTENHKKAIKKILDCGILPELMSLLDVNIVYVQLATLRMIGNIVAGNALQTQMVINAGCLGYLKKKQFFMKKNQ